MSQNGQGPSEAGGLIAYMASNPVAANLLMFGILAAGAVSLGGLARQARAAYFGVEALRVQREEEEVRVYVRLPEGERDSITDVAGYLIRTPSGAEIPLSHVASLNMGTSPPDPVPAGIPADLLLQRPDVQAPRHRLDAAGFTIQVRLAEFMPPLSLSGSIGLQSARIGRLVTRPRARYGV